MITGIFLKSPNNRFHLTINNNDLPNVKYSLTIKKVEANDTGNYTCEQRGPIDGGLRPDKKQFNVLTVTLPKIVNHSPERIETKISQSVLLYCVIEAHPLADFVQTIKWVKDDSNYRNAIYKNGPATSKDDQTSISNRTKFENLDSQRVNVTLDLANIFKKDNGSYSCIVEIPYGNDYDRVFENSRRISATSSVLVLDVPQVSLDFVEAVGASQIFLNWTVNNGNSPITKYFVQFSKEGDATFTYYKDSIDGSKTSHVLDNFEPNTSYQFKIAAKNAIGTSPAYTHPTTVRTLEKDPVFVPVLEVKGMTTNTITIGWHPPSPDLLKYFQYYETSVIEKANSSNIVNDTYPQNSRNLPYMFDNVSKRAHKLITFLYIQILILFCFFLQLKTATEYVFRIRACNELTKLCGDWSANVTGTTSDGAASSPTKLHVSCKYYNISGRTVLSAHWEPPIHRNGHITHYHLELNGVAKYIGKNRALRDETYGPKLKTVEEKQHKADFENIPFNTEYTLKVSAITRSRRPGSVAIGKCSTPRSTPEFKPGDIYWGHSRSDDQYLIKLHMPELSERNGPICGYRIYLVRMPEQLGLDSHKLPPINKLPISTYEEVHASNNQVGGVYIAEAFPALYDGREIVLGDGKPAFDLLPNVKNAECQKLLHGFVPKSRRTTAETIGLIKTTTPDPLFDGKPIFFMKFVCLFFH